MIFDILYIFSKNIAAAVAVAVVEVERSFFFSGAAMQPKFGRKRPRLQPQNKNFEIATPQNSNNLLRECWENSPQPTI